MGHQGRRRPSAALVVAIIALVVAASGSAFAAGKLVSGDSLIAKRSLSGNRLRNRTVTGQQIKLSTLGEVPSAKVAATANALSARGAAALGLDSSFVRSGLVTAADGQTVKMASFGPFTVSLQCNDDGDGTFDAAVMVSSTTANSEAFGDQLTPGTPQQIADAGPDSQFSDNPGGTVADFVAPPDAYLAYVIDAIFMPGTTTPCAASIVVTKS